jgi:hypothetical protein
MSTIRDIAAEAADALSLQRPLSLFGAYDEGDTSDRLLLRALNQTCRHLATSFDWSVLKADHVFATVPQAEQTGAVPADFLRLVIGTVMDRSLRRPLDGPLSDVEYATSSSGTASRVEPAFVLRGDRFFMVPAPPAGRSIAFTYIRGVVGRSSAGVLLQQFASDFDRTLWDNELILLGTVYHARKMSRSDYAQDERDFRAAVHDRIKRDGGGRVLSMADADRDAAGMVARMKRAALVIGG